MIIFAEDMLLGRFLLMSQILSGRIAQLVKCLTADPGVGCSITARSHIFFEIDHEINPTAILLSSADSRRVVVS